MSYHDVARFRPDDPWPVVLASLACPVCLHEADDVALDGAGHDSAARCACDTCRLEWEVALTGWQLARLVLDPAAPGLAR